MNVDRGLWPEAAVAALATLAVAWPVTSLLRGGGWIDGALLMVLLVAVVGVAMRILGAGPTTTVLVQGGLAVWAILLRYLPETLWYSLPTTSTIERAGGLLQEAGEVLRSYAAPAPATPGVEFLIVLVLTLTALSVDAIAVTGRSPATAGIPLAAGFLVSVSNTGEAMEAYYFIAVAVMWLVMIAQQGGRVVGSWSSADRREAVGSHDVSHGPTGYRTVARVIGGLTVIGALLAASLLPHLPPTYFAEGLARSPQGRSLDGTGGSVSFTETMDLRQDLSSQSNAPVLRYRTSSSFLEPLRVTSTSVFEDGEWRPPQYADEPAEAGVGQFQGGTPEGIGEDVITTTAEISVTQNAMRAPFLALPSKVMSADLGVPWGVDEGTGALRVQDPPEQYQAVFLQVAPRGRLPEDVGREPVQGLPRQEQYLRVDPEAEEAVAALAEEVVGDAENDVQVANLIQNHLRNTTYVYSLELAPSAGGTDPITHFLQTRQGYCVQFATAMVMMARHEGIPARMAVGFLSGELQADGTREVLASDAHTWPELYIDGLGWTRFEPTPGARTGIAPAYTQPDSDSAEQDPTAGAEQPVPAPTLPTDAGSGSEDEGWWASLLNLAPGLGRALVLLLVLGLLMALVPWAGRRYREAGIRAARDDAERVEGQWLFLQRSLGDLGVDQPPPRSPREMRTHYLEQTQLDRRSNEALGRVAATLERSRYAAVSEDASQVDAMGRDVRAVVDAVQERLPWNIRVNARLLPRSGVLGLRERLRRLLHR